MSEGGENGDGRWLRRRRTPRVGSTGARFPRFAPDDEPDAAPDAAPSSGGAAEDGAPDDGPTGPTSDPAADPTSDPTAGATADPTSGAIAPTAGPTTPPAPAPAHERRRRRRAPRVGSTGARFPRLPDEPGDALPDPAADSSAPGPSMSGRFTVGEPTVGEPADDTVGRTGARFNSRGRRDRRRAEQIAAENAAAPPRPPLPRHPAEPDADDAPTMPLFVVAAQAAGDSASTRTRVRPYIRTRGRTRARADLAVETLVSIPSPRPPMDDTEHVAIAEVCDGPRSVAEVAALLSVPLGTARVLIDDMAEAGLLRVHPRAVVAGAPRLDMMQRVLEGLHRL